MRKKRLLFDGRNFPEAVVNKKPDQDGIAYGMIYGPRRLGISAGVPLEIQSLRQPSVLYRVQASEYISRYRLGLQAELNYPIARGNTIINSAPRGIGTNSGFAQQGTMRPPRRFTKALPTPIIPYNPPTY